jgi:hypothetical protein
MFTIFGFLAPEFRQQLPHLYEFPPADLRGEFVWYWGDTVADVNPLRWYVSCISDELEKVC